ncbi:MAG: hypothetical protein ICV85_15700 [Tolypothrix sp. T3-bin4]|nr:hypothetical protein [Tolypothrix sp. T3-bin4]
METGSCLFKAFWLYGAVEPLTGESFFWQFSHVDTECYQQFLNEFAACNPDSLNIIQVDNGLFHYAHETASSVKILFYYSSHPIPQNLILLNVFGNILNKI